MNILHISPYLPSLKANHAGGIIMGKQIETLRKEHEVYVLTFIASEYDEALADELRGDHRYHFVKIHKIGKLLHVLTEPWIANYFAARSSLRFACKLIYYVKKYRIEAIHGEYAAMAQYQWICRLFPGLRYHMVEHDVTVQSYERKRNASNGLRRLYYNYQLKRVEACERKYCRRADVVLTFNEKDKKLLEEHYAVSNVRVLNPYFGIEDKDVGSVEKKTDIANSRLCFLGQMGREENVIAAKRLIKIAGMLREQGRKIEVYIVGNHPPDELKQMERDDVHITGFVEDVDPYVAQARAAVFPLTLGAGIKLKVLRSMALGTPVITTRIGAEGIDEEGTVLRLAETDEEFLREIEKLLDMPQEVYSGLCGKSVSFVKERFSWGRSEEVLQELYDSRKQDIHRRK